MFRPAASLPATARLRRLEAVRGFAALYVVMGHFANILLHNPRWCFPLRFSQEAVILFFLLSGFVIYYSTVGPGRRVNARDYFVKRIRRIYPLLLVSLALSYLLISLAVRAWCPPRWPQLLGNLAMLQDFSDGKPGVWVNTFYNPALWSLSYEWWFYLLFFAVWTLLPRPSHHKYAAAGLALAGTVTYQLFPNQLSLFLMYFIIWWCGAEMASEYIAHGRVSWRQQRPALLMLAAIAILWLLPVARLVHAHQPLSLGLHPVMEARHILAALAFLLIALVWRRLGMRGFDATLGLFAVVAPISYGIYILHFPIMTAVESFGPGHLPWLKLALTLALTLPLAYLLEQRMQRRINRWTDRHLLGKLPRPAQSAPTTRRPEFATTP